jgi:prevent-host-death family protein
MESMRYRNIADWCIGLTPFEVARISGYNHGVDVSIAEAKNRLPELIRAVENGENVVITRHGKPVAQLTTPPPERRKPRFGTMKDRIKLYPGWDDPIDLDRFLEGDL